MGDFNRDQPAPAGDGTTSAAPKDQGGAPTTGFVQAPLTPQDRGGPGEAIPPRTRGIR